MTDERTTPSDGRGAGRRARPSAAPARRRPAHRRRGQRSGPGRPRSGRDRRRAGIRAASRRRRRRAADRLGGRRRTATRRRQTATESEAARVTVAEVLADVPEDAVIVARRLTKQYGEFTAVDRLDLTIRRGEVFGLLGPNGAGKTTTVLMLLGLTEPTKGVVRVVGLDPTREPLAVKRQVGYLPDNVGFYAGLTGRENLRYTAKLNGIARTEAEARIDELLAEVRLEDAADKKAEHVLARHAPAAGHRGRPGEEPVRAHPRRADDRDRPGRRGGAARAAAAPRQGASTSRSCSLPHPGPGPVALRPGRVLLRGQAGRRGAARGARRRRGPARAAGGRDRGAARGHRRRRAGRPGRHRGRSRPARGAAADRDRQRTTSPRPSPRPSPAPG